MSDHIERECPTCRSYLCSGCGSDEGRRARIIGPIEAVAKMIDKKADDFAREHGHDDMGGLSFGRGPQAEVKMDHHSTLVELAEEIRSIKLPDDMGYKSIDMVLHCPKCGMQHIDKDNYEELRIEAAELGVDREGERELERWIEDREWPNPPHRSHQCQNRKCGHIWRPADVPTNGVAAIKTAGTKDDPITSPSVEFQILKAEHDNLKSSYDRLKLAYDAWHEKTNWIHKTIKPAELGQHIADVMTARLLCLRDGPYTLTQYFEFEERIYDRMLRYYMASGDLAKVYPAWQVKVFECIRTKKLKKPWELATKEYTFELARDIAKTIDEA